MPGRGLDEALGERRFDHDLARGDAVQRVGEHLHSRDALLEPVADALRADLQHAHRPMWKTGGALVFDAVLHAPPPDDTTKIAVVHCQYPCVAELPATSLFAGLPVEKQAAVKIPLSCFVSAGLDPRKVNTPFVVYSQRRMDVTFSNVRIETGAADDADVTSCTELR
ncbi:putative glycoside hydrolase [Saccharopolyspora sp. NPDC050642]|uniref:putative glycoside hydrolase n=1 Tax=Saccharopolyspora sp. NPDC050642 TaxID=3157099 RepID=UPI0034026296